MAALWDLDPSPALLSS